jgi:excisionase family DNA binding protein
VPAGSVCLAERDSVYPLAPPCKQVPFTTAANGSSKNAHAPVSNTTPGASLPMLSGRLLVVGSYSERNRAPQYARALLPDALQRRSACFGFGSVHRDRKPAPHPVSAQSHAEVPSQRRKPYNAAPQRRGRAKHRSSIGSRAPAHSWHIMTKLITIPRFAELTGLSYRLCLHLLATGDIPSVPVGRRRRIDVRWVEQWLASGGYSATSTNRADLVEVICQREP